MLTVRCVSQTHSTRGCEGVVSLYSCIEAWLYDVTGFYNVYMDGVEREANASVLLRGLELVCVDGERFRKDNHLLMFISNSAWLHWYGRVCTRLKLLVNEGTTKVVRCSTCEWKLIILSTWAF